jgi:hypothetical protein
MTKIVNRVKALHAARSGQLPDLGLLAGRPAVGTAPFDSAEEDHKQDNNRREMLEELLMGWPSSCGQNHSAGDPGEAGFQSHHEQMGRQPNMAAHPCAAEKRRLHRLFP